MIMTMIINIQCRFWDFRIGGFLGFLAALVLWIFGYISGTKRATRDPLVSKRPEFNEGFSNFWISVFLYLWNSGFLKKKTWSYLGEEQRSAGVKTPDV